MGKLIKLISVLVIISSLALVLSAESYTSSAKNTTSRGEAKTQPTESLVRELNELNFDKFNNETDYYYLQFYAPWCPHCNQLNPIYEKAAKLSKEEKLPGVYVKVDATANPNLAEKYEVRGYPTLYWVDNKANTKYGYTGERDPTQFVNFQRKKLKLFNLDENGSLEDINTFVNRTSSTSNVLLVVVNNNNKNAYDEEIKNLLIAAGDNNYGKVFLNHSEAVINHFNLQNDKLAILSFLYNKETNNLREPEKITFNLEDLVNEKSASELISKYKFEPYNELNDDLLDSVIDKAETSLIFIYSDEETQGQNLTNAHNILREYAIENRRNFHVFHAEAKNKGITVLVEVLNLRKEDMPLLLLTQKSEYKVSSELLDEPELDKFRLDNFDLTRESVDQFVSDWRNGKLVPFLASEIIPENPYDKYGVYKVVGKTFDNFLLTKGKDLILSICSPIIKRCKNFNQRLGRVVEKLKNNTELLFASVDPNFNEFRVQITPKFPSILFFPNENEDLNVTIRFENRIEFNGDFTTRNITDFIIQNARHNIVVNTLEDEAKIDREEAKDFIESRAEEEEQDFNMEDFLETDLGKRLKGQYGAQGAEGAEGEQPDLSSLLGGMNGLEGNMEDSEGQSEMSNDESDEGETDELDKSDDDTDFEGSESESSNSSSRSSSSSDSSSSSNLSSEAPLDKVDETEQQDLTQLNSSESENAKEEKKPDL